MAATASLKTRRPSVVSSNMWVDLPSKPAPTMAEAQRDQAARELMRNAPEVFTQGALQGFQPAFTWEDLYSETEVAIIKEGVAMKNFNQFLEFMVQLFPESKRPKVVYHTIRLWNQVCELKGQ